MRLTTISSIEPNHPADGVLYVMFHGYGNDEEEMVRIITAVDPDADYISFRGVISRPFLGGNAWYDADDAGEQIRLRCSAIGDEIVDQLDSTSTHQKRIVLVGFSQGGYLAYRILAEHADIIDSAILLSPAFHGNGSVDEDVLPDDVSDDKPGVFLAYGSGDREIPDEQQQGIRDALAEFSDVEDHVYPGLDHDVSSEELEDVKQFMGL